MTHLTEFEIVDFFRGTLSPSKHSQVEAHLSHCVDCSEMLSIFLHIQASDDPEVEEITDAEAVARTTQILELIEQDERKFI